MDERSVMRQPESPPHPPPPASFKKLVETRMRPISFMNANVRRSSLGLPPTRSLLGIQRAVVAVSSGQVSTGETSSQDAPPREDNQVKVEEKEQKENDDSIASSGGTTTASQCFSVVLDPSALEEEQASSSSKKSKKRGGGGFLGRIISRSGSKKSSSSSATVATAASSTGGGTVNEELEISVIQTLEEEESCDNGNDEGTGRKKMKKKPKFPKVMLCFRRLRKAVVARGKKNRDEGNVTIEEVPEENMEMEEVKGATTTDENNPEQPVMMMMCGENGNDVAAAVAEEEQGDFAGLAETNVVGDDSAVAAAVRGADFVVTIEAEPAAAPKQRQRKVKASKRGHGGVLEWTINFHYYTGLSPFRFDERGRIVSTPLSKAAFLAMYGNAILHSIGQVHVQYMELLTRESYGDKAYWFILVFYHMAVTVHLILLFKCLWFDQKDIRRTVRAERRCSLTNVKSAKYFAAGGRIWSTLVSLGCAIGGFGLIQELAGWSFRELLEVCESDLFYGLLNFGGSASVDDVDAHAAAAISTIIGENYTSSDPFFNATQQPIMSSNMTNQNVTVFLLGRFIHDGKLETSILGSIGIFMNFCYQSVLSSGPEIMLSSITSLWLGTRGLGLGKITRSQRQENSTDGDNDGDEDDDDNAGIDIDTEDEDYTEEQREEILRMNAKFESLHRLSNKQNDALKSFWPSLALVILIMVVFVVFGVSIRHWFSTSGVALRIIPILVGFFLAIKVNQKSDEYHTWFITPRAQKVLKSGVQKFQMKMAQLILQPFGFGNGSFLINASYLANVFGSTSTYFLLMSQSFNANKEKE